MSRRRFYVQTPNRWFPIEPHYQLPLFQFLRRARPQSAQPALHAGLAGGGQWEEITLLGARDLRRLFPDAEIHREKVLGLTKSLIAVRRTGAGRRSARTIATSGTRSPRRGTRPGDGQD